MPGIGPNGPQFFWIGLGLVQDSAFGSALARYGLCRTTPLFTPKNHRVSSEDAWSCLHSDNRPQLFLRRRRPSAIRGRLDFTFQMAPGEDVVGRLFTLRIASAPSSS